MKYIFVIARVLLGLVFTVFGLTVVYISSDSASARSRGTVHGSFIRLALLRDRIWNGNHRRCDATQQPLRAARTRA